MWRKALLLKYIGLPIPPPPPPPVATSCFKYMGYNTFFFFFLHFTIDVLNLKLCFATDVLTEGSGSLSEPGSNFFFHSDLYLLMEFLYFTG